VNLYPFLSALQEGDKDLNAMIELIDIGGPAMLRAGAKNHENVVVLHNSSQYEIFAEAFINNAGSIPRNLSARWASEAFFYTSYYDSQIAAYLDSINEESQFPAKMSLFFSDKKELRYGENPHQAAAIYHPFGEFNIKNLITQLHGKEMSFNNYVDVSAAFSLVSEFEDIAVAIIKHTNPCGVAIAESLPEAFQRAHAGDPISAFGGIIATNREVDKDTAAIITKTFFECVIAPSYSAAALEILKRKKNLRLLQIEPDVVPTFKTDYKFLDIGFLVQEADSLTYDESSSRIEGDKQPTEREMEDLIFAWKVAKHVKSNAIVLAKNKQIVGVGAGQVSRVDSVELACKKAEKAGHQLKGSVLASDAFFPFRDGVDEAVKNGISAIIQPGGSVRDSEVIEAAREQSVSMLLTGLRHFKH
jgi:phosphoribosylaminoimidazolecarboxamide formyltransferase/IMP cyclohydrolase